MNPTLLASVVRHYSDVPVALYKASATTPIPVQASIFRDFDILISPHGSQLSLMAFGNGNAVLVEVAPIQFEPVFCRNAQAFARGYVQSLGHDTTTMQRNETLRKVRDQCLTQVGFECQRKVLLLGAPIDLNEATIPVYRGDT